MTAGDKKLILVVLAIAVLAGGGVLLRNLLVNPGGVAVISVDNSPVQTVPLVPSEAMRRFVVVGTRGELLIETEGESIKVVEADCPDGVCIGMGAKSRPGDVIVCMPNRVIIRVQERAND